MLPSALEFNPLLAILYFLTIYAFFLVMARQLLKTDACSAALSQASGRLGCIDGLRGLLAVGVLTHHTFAAYGFFTKGLWTWSTSSILNQLGQSTVALFFMITGFLFTLKAANKAMDWRKLYFSRIARLLPLYFLVVCCVFVLVFYLSNWKFLDSTYQVARQFVLWLTFVCIDRPDVNEFPMTWTLIAGVNWTLKYEVLFYIFAVPGLHLLQRVLPPKLTAGVVLVSLVLLLAIATRKGISGGEVIYSVQFLGGVLVACLIQFQEGRAAVRSKSMRILAVLALIAISCMQSSANWLAVAATTVIFSSVVGGASIFGLLKTRPAVWLGDVSYGIYLLHGLAIWLALKCGGRVFDISRIDLPSYLGAMLTASALVLMLASVSYVNFERPLLARAR